MSTSAIEIREALAQNLTSDDASLIVDLDDGRTIAVPLAWLPRLAHATPQERSVWCLIGGGVGIHWPELDEDISVESLLAGRRSGENQQSLQSWLLGRKAAGNS